MYFNKPLHKSLQKKSNSEYQNQYKRNIHQNNKQQSGSSWPPFTINLAYQFDNKNHTSRLYKTEISKCPGNDSDTNAFVQDISDCNRMNFTTTDIFCTLRNSKVQVRGVSTSALYHCHNHTTQQKVAKESYDHITQSYLSDLLDYKKEQITKDWIRWNSLLSPKPGIWENKNYNKSYQVDNRDSREEDTSIRDNIIFNAIMSGLGGTVVITVILLILYASFNEAKKIRNQSIREDEEAPTLNPSSHRI